MLTDNTFRPFSRMSMKTSGEALERAQPVGFVFSWFGLVVVWLLGADVFLWVSFSGFRVGLFEGRWRVWGYRLWFRRRVWSCPLRCFRSRLWLRIKVEGNAFSF